MAIDQPSTVESVSIRLKDLLRRASKIKTAYAVEPPLPASEFAGDLGIPPLEGVDKANHFQGVEISAKGLFQDLVVSLNLLL
jgi:hypothetical protein